MKPLKVIDLFAGPGGLGEGFSAHRTPAGHQAFKIALSIEKEASAHRTLTLRSFFRQFDDGEAPESYYAFLRGELGASPEDELYRLPELRDAVEHAHHEAQAIELGVTNQETIYRKVRESLGGEDFILIGGPPCQAYSLVGRSRNQGDKSRTYDPDQDHRNFLYKEYLRIIAKFQPVAFIMENVKGMLSARTAAGAVFPRIRADLIDPCRSSGINPDRGRHKNKYKILSFVVNSNNDLFTENEALRPTDFVIKAEEFGIPQSRHRVIMLGIREDIAEVWKPDQLQKKEEFISLGTVLSGLPKVRSGLSKEADDSDVWARIPSQTEALLTKEKPLKRDLSDEIVEGCTKTLDPTLSRGQEFGMKAKYDLMPDHLRNWYEDPRMLGFITNHTTRGHIRQDLARYWFASSYTRETGKSPKATEFPKSLWPAHANFGSGKFADRFRVQSWDAPSSTITSHISKDGHYFIHPDPDQMRSLTVREAARLQTFPDNYHFVGNRTQQYVQVGNAVPPLLAAALAKILAVDALT